MSVSKVDVPYPLTKNKKRDYQIIHYRRRVPFEDKRAASFLRAYKCRTYREIKSHAVALVQSLGLPVSCIDELLDRSARWLLRGENVTAYRLWSYITRKENACKPTSDLYDVLG